MKKKFDNGDKPKYLRVDAGGEFLSHTFTQMCAKHNVKVYIAQEPIKCAFIERFNRTFKRILVQLNIISFILSMSLGKKRYSISCIIYDIDHRIIIVTIAKILTMHSGT